MSDAHSSTPADRGEAGKAGPDGDRNEKTIEIKAIATTPASLLTCLRIHPNVNRQVSQPATTPGRRPDHS